MDRLGRPAWDWRALGGPTTRPRCAWATRTRLADHIDVIGDVALPIALLPDGWGVAVVAGTGSCVWARGPDGRTARAGGWGSLLGDEGSGYAIAVDALKAICRSTDRRLTSTSLGERLLPAMELTDPNQLVSAVHGGAWDRTRIAALATEVIRAADEGDGVAEGIVQAQANELAVCVAAVSESLCLPREAIPLAATGGLLVKGASYRPFAFSIALRRAAYNRHRYSSSPSRPKVL